MPISISREMVEEALNIVYEQDLVHFDFKCPKCKKNNRVSKEQLEHAAPGWEYQPPKDKK
jgi:transposase-like protein